MLVFTSLKKRKMKTNRENEEEWGTMKNKQDEE